MSTHTLLEFFGILFLVLLGLIFLSILILYFGFYFFLKKSGTTLNCSAMSKDIRYSTELLLPIHTNIYQSSVARALLEIDLAVTSANCPNIIIPLPFAFDYMKLIYGTNPITGESTFYATYFYSKQYRTPMIIFSGTALYSEWIEDIRFSQTKPTKINNLTPVGTDVLVHTGFYQIYTSVQEELRTLVRESGDYDQLIISGHSLGGALSTLCAIDFYNSQDPRMNEKLVHYTFAAPRVGNISFASIFNSYVGYSYRIFNTEDIVPTLPPAVIESYIYEQTGVNIDFTENLASVEGNHTQAYIDFLSKNS